MFDLKPLTATVHKNYMVQKIMKGSSPCFGPFPTEMAAQAWAWEQAKLMGSPRVVDDKIVTDNGNVTFFVLGLRTPGEG